MSLKPAFVVALSLSLATAHAAAAEPTRYLELSNRSYDTMTALAVAEPGSNAFTDVALGASLRGGGHAVTVEITGDACRYDLRFTFKNGRSMIYPDVDVCAQRLSVRPLPRAPASTRDVATAAGLPD